jgi:hypothetical protein
MIQLNLLPDVKLEYIKAKKVRSLVTGVSVIVSITAIAILAILFFFNLNQKDRISNHKTAIASLTSQLEGKPNINKIITVQNQLESLSSLYAQRPAAYRLFDTYLSKLTPEAVSINNLNIQFSAGTATITGSTNNLVTVNQYVDTLKLTTYTVNGSSANLPAFSNVVLSSFGLSSQVQNPAQAASFTINLNFASAIFNSTEKINLNIPNLVITHFEKSDTGSLFKSAPAGSVTTNTIGGQP